MLRRFYPAAWDAVWHERLRGLSRRIGDDSVERMRAALAFAREVALDDRQRITAFTLDLARAVAQADLAFLADVRGARREMEERVRSVGGRSEHALGSGMPAWADETLRLGSSTGLDASTELLPAPARPAASELP